jgi:hypothetical protein
MPDRYTHTLMFLTREMNEEASIQERLDNLHNLWTAFDYKQKDGNCVGCGAYLYHRWYLRHLHTGEICYIGSSCQELFKESAPLFYETSKELREECKARQRVFNRKIPEWASDLSGIPLTNYRSVHKAIQNKTKRYVNESGYPQDMTKLIEVIVNALPETDRKHMNFI